MTPCYPFSLENGFDAVASLQVIEIRALFASRPLSHSTQRSRLISDTLDGKRRRGQDATFCQSLYARNQLIIRVLRGDNLNPDR